MNPIAVALIVFGVVLILFGVFLVFLRRKGFGIGIGLLGLGVVAVPFLVSVYLAK